MKVNEIQSTYLNNKSYIIILQREKVNIKAFKKTF
jgi:hypothetical protein